MVGTQTAYTVPFETPPDPADLGLPCKPMVVLMALVVWTTVALVWMVTTRVLFLSAATPLRGHLPRQNPDRYPPQGVYNLSLD